MEFGLGGGFADDGASEVEEVEVDGFEEGEKGDGVLKLGGDGVFEDGEEFGEEELDETLLALRVGWAENVGCELAEGCG